MDTKISNNTLPDENEIGVREVSVTYVQRQDNAVYSDKLDDQTLKISTVDADAGGYYYTIETKRWAFDDLEELEKIFKDFLNRVYTKNDNRLQV